MLVDVGMIVLKKIKEIWKNWGSCAEHTTGGRLEFNGGADDGGHPDVSIFLEHREGHPDHTTGARSESDIGAN